MTQRVRRKGTLVVLLLPVAITVIVGCSRDASTSASLCSSSDGTQAVTGGDIVFASDRRGSFDLWLTDATGSDPVQLTESKGFEVEAAWSPTGEQIAFAAGPETTSLEDVTAADICVVSRDGSGMRSLTSTDDQVEFSPTWSPDGRRIAYTADSGEGPRLWVMDSDGTNQRQISSDDSAYDWPRWSPDGRYIVYSATPQGAEQQEIWVMAADGKDPHRLGGEVGDSQAVWSPDGESLSFTRAQNGDAEIPTDWNEDVYVMAADGGNQRRLTQLPGNDHWPATWSPDGQALAFTSDGLEENSDIMLIQLDGSSPEQLTDDPAQDLFPSWRPKPAG